MKYSGVIFDFNGTLFWDTPLHNKAWNMFLEKRGMHLSDHEFFATFHGKNNRDIFNSLFQREHPAEEIRALVDEKETLYRQLCLETEMIPRFSSRKKGSVHHCHRFRQRECGLLLRAFGNRQMVRL